MPDNISIGHRAKQVEKSPRFNGVTGVRMLVDDETEVSSGDESGFVFEIESPWASQQQATWLLNKMRDYAYQPYQAERTILDPSAEMGDYVSVQGLFGGLFRDNNVFGTMFTSDIGAPQSEDVDHEFNYKSKADRRFERKMRQIAAEFAIQADQISAKVSQIGGDNRSFGWSMTIDGMHWYANGSEVMRCTQAGLKITGEINATSGVIGGATIKNGTLTIANANITNINGSKIDNYSIGTQKYGIGSVTGGGGGAIGGGTITSGNTKFPNSITGGQTSFDAANNISPFPSLWTTSLRLGSGTQCGIQTFSFVDGNGNTRSFQYVGPY